MHWFSMEEGSLMLVAWVSSTLVVGDSLSFLAPLATFLRNLVCTQTQSHNYH